MEEMMTVVMKMTGDYKMSNLRDIFKTQNNVKFKC